MSSRGVVPKANNDAREATELNRVRSSSTGTIWRRGACVAAFVLAAMAFKPAMAEEPAKAADAPTAGTTAANPTATPNAPSPVAQKGGVSTGKSVDFSKAGAPRVRTEIAEVVAPVEPGKVSIQRFQPVGSARSCVAQRLEHSTPAGFSALWKRGTPDPITAQTAGGGAPL